MEASEKLMKSVDEFVIKVNTEIGIHYKTNFPSLTPKLIKIKQGQRYIKLISDRSVWGFISKYDGEFKGVPIKVGDLMKAASWSAPAKHSRGNVINGTTSYTTYGPSYLI